MTPTKRNLLIGAVVLVAILVVAGWAYTQCKFDGFLPDSLKYGKCTSTFVGVHGGDPWLVPCAFPNYDKDGNFNGTYFNRCAYA